MRVGSPRQMHNPYNACDRQEARTRHGMRSRRCTMCSMHEVDRGVYYDIDTTDTFTMTWACLHGMRPFSVTRDSLLAV